MLKRVNKYKWEISIIIGIMLMLLVFAFQKEGYHMDEMISFEMSNAEYNPWIVPKQPVGRLAKFMQEEIEADTLGEKLKNIGNTVCDVLKNRGNSKMLSYKADVYEEPVWITREQFRDYLTTDGNDNFNYLSVYFNVKDDNHPPIHFMLLHTVSSLFAGRIHPIMGCIINILMIAGCAVIIMKCGTLLDRFEITDQGVGRRMGMLGAMLYACSHASIATMLLIRMYAVLTFLCLLTFYIHMEKWLGNGFGKKNKLLVFITALGFWTQYFFLFYCISLSLVIVIGLARNKRINELVVYIRNMVTAAVIGVVGFPFAISDVFSSSRGVEALDNLQGGWGEYITRLGRFGEILLSRCFGNVWIGVLLLLITVGMAVYWSFRYKERRMMIMMYYIPVILYFMLAAKMSPMYVDRYLMAIFPFVISWLVPILCVKSIEKKVFRVFSIVGVVIYCGIQLITYDGSYLYRGYNKQIAISEEYADIPCICLYEGSGYYDNLMEFTNYNKTLLVTPAELMERVEIDSIQESENMIFVVKNIVSEEQIREILQKYSLQVKDVLIYEGAHGDKVYFCCKAQKR